MRIPVSTNSHAAKPHTKAGDPADAEVPGQGCKMSWHVSPRPCGRAGEREPCCSWRSPCDASGRPCDGSAWFPCGVVDPWYDVCMWLESRRACPMLNGALSIHFRARDGKPKMRNFIVLRKKSATRSSASRAEARRQADRLSVSPSDQLHPLPLLYLSSTSLLLLRCLSAASCAIKSILSAHIVLV